MESKQTTPALAENGSNYDHEKAIKAFDETKTGGKGLVDAGGLLSLFWFTVGADLLSRLLFALQAIEEQFLGDGRIVTRLEGVEAGVGHGPVEEDEIFILEEPAESQMETRFFCVLGKAIFGDQVLTQVPLLEVLLWVKILDIPLNQRTMKNVSGIAERAEKFVGFDEKGAVGWGKFVRARIWLNTKKPLRKSLAVHKEEGQMVEVSFQYEGIPNFCYICGKLGHTLKKCESRNEDSNEEEKLDFGEWLQASPRKLYSVRLEAAR
ncbi:hypothetical protein Tsubulata_011257 [Turnera subulata]|uniref:CCHC-type domain-containing protein n=1 Tax=Turnera subulata TaxID=218843 RepID=A0A9Q0FW56_9ROSI|nr:hypothetical protein Tsubulata_011257 [Turnera subulata]